MVHPKSTSERIWNSISLGIKQLGYSYFLMKGLQAFVLCLWYIKRLPCFPLSHYFFFQRFLCFALICLLFSQITLRFRGLPWFDRPLCLQTLPLVGFYSSLSIMIAKFNLMSEDSHAPDSRRNLLSSFPMSPSNRQQLDYSCYPLQHQGLHSCCCENLANLLPISLNQV